MRDTWCRLSDLQGRQDTMEKASLCMLVSISPGQGDTGIRRDEPQIEEAVIEVFKKVRGD